MLGSLGNFHNFLLMTHNASIVHLLQGIVRDGRILHHADQDALAENRAVTAQVVLTQPDARVAQTGGNLAKDSQDMVSKRIQAIIVQSLLLDQPTN